MADIHGEDKPDTKPCNVHAACTFRNLSRGALSECVGIIAVEAPFSEKIDRWDCEVLFFKCDIQGEVHNLAAL